MDAKELGQHTVYPKVMANISQFPDGTTLTEFMGLTKREWFAGMAMQGLLANPDNNARFNSEGIALNARKAADAMLEELVKKPL